MSDILLCIVTLLLLLLLRRLVVYAKWNQLYLLMWTCQSEDRKINVWRQFYIKFTAVIYIRK